MHNHSFMDFKSYIASSVRPSVTHSRILSLTVSPTLFSCFFHLLHTVYHLF